MKYTFGELFFVGGSCFIYVICIYLLILVFNTISISDEHTRSSPSFNDVRVIFCFCLVFCKSVFVWFIPPNTTFRRHRLSIPLSLFYWLLYCLSFFDLRLLTTQLISSSLSFIVRSL